MDFLGIDISKADFHVHLLQGAHSAKRSFPNAPAGYAQLDRWLKNRKSTALHACMEATGAYWLGLATHLHASEVAVSVVNPARIKSFARSQLRRTKTDVVDAEIIADFCRTQAPGRWEPPLREHQEIRALLTYRDHLVAEKVRAKQLIATVYQADVFQLTARAHQKQLEDLIDSTEKQMRALIASTPSLLQATQLLESIPGIGWLTAASLAVRLPMDRLSTSKAAAAHAGLTPRERQSGTSVHGRPRICKTGDAQLRKALYMPALAALRGTSHLAQFGARLKAAGKPGKVVIAAMMRKLVTIAYAILKSGQPFTIPPTLDMQHSI